MLAMGVSWAPLWPSVVALVWVVLFRRVLFALVGGAFAGAVLLAQGNPFAAFVALFEVHLLPHFGDRWKAGALIFTLVLGGFATVLERSGVLRRWLERRHAEGSPRKLEATAMGIGLVCFFDGLANSLMVGRLFRDLADRTGVSRVRLAYIVDTTSAAVACLAFISTWIAFQLSQIREGLALAGRADFADPYGLFFASIPFNFYSWFALVLLGVVIWRQWQWGAMARAKPAAGEPVAPGGSNDGVDDCGAIGLWRFFVPLVVLVGAILLGIYFDGAAKLGQEGESMGWAARVAAAFGQAQAAVVMVWASVLGAIAAVLCFPRKAGGASGGLAAFEEGVLGLFKPALILVGAWMLSSVLDELEARRILAALLGDRLPFPLLPAAVFVVASLTSFTTGTSWGTMGILMPLALPLVFSISPEADVASQHTVLVGVIAAVFSGAVFGDHASPLSDTTIVSSIACGIEPVEHVRTQLPYALAAGGVALFLGFLPMAWISTPGVLLGLGVGSIVFAGWVFGRPWTG